MVEDPYAFLALHKESEPLTLFELEDLEERMAKAIPEQYRKFLLHHNGGSPTPRSFAIHTPQGIAERHIEWFLGITEALDRGDDIEKNMTTFPWLFRDYYPFAVDKQWKFLLLVVGQKDKICYYDHEPWLEPKGVIATEKMMEVDDSFDLFLAHLY